MLQWTTVSCNPANNYQFATDLFLALAVFEADHRHSILSIYTQNTCFTMYIFLEGKNSLKKYAHIMITPKQIINNSFIIR